MNIVKSFYELRYEIHRYLLYILFISSCNQEKQKIKCIYDSTIRFPERMEIWRGNEKGESHYHQNAPIKLVMFILT